MSESGQLLVYELRLHLAGANRQRLLESREHLDQIGIHVTTLAAEQGRDIWAVRRIYRLHNQLRRQQPPGWFHGADVPFALWSEAYIRGERQSALPDAYLLAMQGDTYVGLSAGQSMRRDPAVLMGEFTGVLPQYRGQGIASGLKAALILQAIDSGYHEMRSAVLAENTAMLRINESFGFHRYRQFVQNQSAPGQ